MVRSCEREGWSGCKLDLVWTSLWCIDYSVWFLKAWMCCSLRSLWWFSEPFLGDFLGVISGPFSWEFGAGCMHEPFVILFPLIPLPNPWAKGLDFVVLGVLGLEEFLAGFHQFLLIWQVLVDKIFDMDSPWGVPTIPKVLRKSVERYGRSGVGFGEVDPRVMFIPRAQLGFCSGEHLSGFIVVPCCSCFEFGSFGAR
jgi:hypothetical protein